MKKTFFSYVMWLHSMRKKWLKFIFVLNTKLYEVSFLSNGMVLSVLVASHPAKNPQNPQITSLSWAKCSPQGTHSCWLWSNLISQEVSLPSDSWHEDKIQDCSEHFNLKLNKHIMWQSLTWKQITFRMTYVTLKGYFAFFYMKENLNTNYLICTIFWQIIWIKNELPSRSLSKVELHNLEWLNYKSIDYN